MKKLLLLVALMPCISFFHSQAQKSPYSYGRVSEDELKMEVYDRDTSASAVFLYEKVNVYFDISRDINLVKEYSARIKILDNDGTSWADVEIPYFETTGRKELLNITDATAYNLVDGKIVKTPLKKQMIFREQANEQVMVAKFSIPDVRAGTVIEYRYKLTSGYYYDVPDVDIQHSIPVAYSYARVGIPEWFYHTINVRGFHRIDVKKERKQETFSLAGARADYLVQYYTVEREHMPAIKSEPFVWNHDNLKTKIEFEVTGYKFPNQLAQHFSVTWESVFSFLDKTDFSRYMKMSCPYADAVKQLRAVEGGNLELARSVLKYVQSNVKWNGRYCLIGEQLRNALKEGSGSSAAINFLIMSGLRECGFSVKPLLLNPRSFGRIPYGRPTIDNINAFVILLEMPEGMFFVDGTDPFSDIGVLPVNLLVDRARIYGEKDDDRGWVDLSTPANNSQRHIINASVNTDGTVDVDHMIVTNYNLSIAANRKYYAAGSEEKYIEQLEEEVGVTIEEYEIEGAGTIGLTEKFRYKVDMERAGDDFMVRAAMMRFMEENILPDQERTLPIEFDFPYVVDIICNIRFPEGMGVSQVPENISMQACDQGAGYSYVSQNNGFLLNVRMTYKLNRTLYTTSEYDDLRAFYAMVTDKSNSRIIISRL